MRALADGDHEAERAVAVYLDPSGLIETSAFVFRRASLQVIVSVSRGKRRQCRAEYESSGEARLGHSLGRPPAVMRHALRGRRRPRGPPPILSWCRPLLRVHPYGLFGHLQAPMRARSAGLPGGRELTRGQRQQRRAWSAEW
eukprot:scaffold3180_cov399-Prasinococcus_capsulatus_cf.AAC.14